MADFHYFGFFFLKKRPYFERIEVGTEKAETKKFLFGVWGLILSRYDIKYFIYDIRSKI